MVGQVRIYKGERIQGKGLVKLIFVYTNEIKNRFFRQWNFNEYFKQCTEHFFKNFAYTNMTFYHPSSQYPFPSWSHAQCCALAPPWWKVCTKERRTGFGPLGDNALCCTVLSWILRTFHGDEYLSLLKSLLIYKILRFRPCDEWYFIADVSLIYVSCTVKIY